MGRWDRSAFPVRTAARVFQDLLDLWVQLDRVAPVVPLEKLVKREQKALMVSRDFLVKQVMPVPLVQTVKMVLRDQTELVVLQDLLVRLAIRVLREPRVSPDLRDKRVMMGQQVQMERTVPPVKMVNLAHRVLPEHQGLLVHPVVLVLEVLRDLRDHEDSKVISALWDRLDHLEQSDQLVCLDNLENKVKLVYLVIPDILDWLARKGERACVDLPAHVAHLELLSFLK